eukprot:CAMPEP_0168323900 /NCGR_PEP_ID=MMETSP0213-20121227/3762_1 /TAXON_ID=151035 /ORGANISM="Euplotes harpa, Strain FSP1.4" /LENGTH=74 /DNA_ID=CAMNT_0008326071 /DNA_START=266 /DNA_END=487 /DNA_ORIENTATION=+
MVKNQRLSQQTQPTYPVHNASDHYLKYINDEVDLSESYMFKENPCHYEVKSVRECNESESTKRGESSEYEARLN